MPPTKKPGLNADARAVLLVAQIADVPRPFIIPRGDVRRAQFERGRERLRAAGMLDGADDFLNDAGADAARALQENDARLHAGIPYEERAAAISLRGGRDTAAVEDGWQPLELDGQPAFTNGYVLMLGVPPSAVWPRKTFPPQAVQRAWTAAGEAAPNRVRPVAYFETQGYKERTRHAVLSSGVCVDADALNFMLARAPGAILTHDATADKRSSGYVLSFYVEGRRVGMLMPYTAERRDGVAAILDAQGEQETERLRPVITDADRAARVGRFLGGRINGKADSAEADYSFYQHADRLAELAGRAKYPDLLAALREKPAHVLTFLLMCWQDAGRELMACTGRTRGEWLGMIDEPGGQAEEEEEREAQARPTPEPAPLPSFDGRRARQLGLGF
jgi:hypothetical protein